MTNTRRWLTRGFTFAFSVLIFLATTAAGQQPSSNEFVPIDQLPPGEQLPGGAFVVVAYGFLWVATMVYVWSVWRRLHKVEAEMETVIRRQGSTTR